MSFECGVTISSLSARAHEDINTWNNIWDAKPIAPVSKRWSTGQQDYCTPGFLAYRPAYNQGPAKLGLWFAIKLSDGGRTPLTAL
jgi:hypothetical protein